MATMKIPYDGKWVYVTDPTAEKMIYKTPTEPTKAVEGSLWIDTSDINVETTTGIGITASISLLNTYWELIEENRYIQTIELAGIPNNVKVDLMPDADTLYSINSSESMLYISNNNGVFTCYCLGNKPTENLVIPVYITEINNDANAVITGNIIGSSSVSIQWGRWGTQTEE